MADLDAIKEVARRIAVETNGFTGGDLKLFAKVGRYTLNSLKRNGLKRSSKVLDYGCGSLRVGYWLVRFLRAGCYYGIEPNQKLLGPGIKHALGPELVDEKRPRFSNVARFDFSVFGEKFDFVVARSIFSHASPEQFLTAMESFRENSADGAVMLASYRPLRARDGDADIVDPNPEGPNWRLRRFNRSWLRARARERGLAADNFGEPFNGQVWLKLSKADTKTAN
jgi:SAM-dependent methyltransferase